MRSGGDRLPEDAARWKSAIEKGIRSVFPGITRVVISTGDGCYPPDDGLSRMVRGMKEVKADELLFEMEDGKLLVVKHDYGDLAAAVHYDGAISPADLSRLIQLMFARRELRACDKATLPASEVETALKRWKYRIGLVFGKKFATWLVESAVKDKNPLTVGELERHRAVISSALGDCLLLDKVNK